MKEDRETELKRKIKGLENTISQLQTELLSKDIIIDALVAKLKTPEPQQEFTKNNHVKRPKGNLVEAPLPGLDVQASEETTSELHEPNIANTLPQLTNSIQPEEKPHIDETCVPYNVAELASQIKDIFVQKSKNLDFKLNFSLKKFVDYAELSYEFSLFNKKVVKTKNPLKQFIEINLQKILKFVIENINILNLNQICSTVFLINSEISYKQKLVVVHDLILELNNYSKLNFIASALFNNLDLENDIFSQIIKKIMYHQLCIDNNLLKNTEVIEHLGIIRDNFSLSASEVGLWDCLSHFIIKHELFDQDKKRILADAIENGFLLRMVCHYLDWDYTYNNFILMQLYPKLLLDKGSIHAYYLGILMMNANRFLGTDESTKEIENELLSILDWKNESSIAAYMILKQIRSEDANKWMNENVEWLRKEGYRVEYLKGFLLI